jgi:amino acid transporter
MPVAFFIAGTSALITAYSYIKLSIRYTSLGGTAEFIYPVFGSGTTTGAFNILLRLSYIVMLSLFGIYSASLFSANLQPVIKHLLISVSNNYFYNTE